jgi:hypothetical protein
MSEGHLVSIWCQPLRNGNRPVSAPTTSGTSSVIDPTYCYDGNPGDDTYMGGSGPGGYTSQALYHSWPSLTTTAAATLNIQASTLANCTGFRVAQCDNLRGQLLRILGGSDDSSCSGRRFR